MTPKIPLLLLFSMLASTVYGAEIKDAQPLAMYDKDGNLTDSIAAAYWPQLNNANGQNNKWKAVGQLLGNGEGGCTVNLVKIPNCPKPKKPQVVTNGHCVDGMKKNWEVKFGAFADATPSDQMTVKANPIYSTFFSKDIAIMELDTDYESLARVIKPFEIAKTPLNTSTHYETVGVPVDGLSGKQISLRRGVCTPAAEKMKNVVNAQYMWDDEMLVSGCTVRGGASGSGLFDKDLIYGLLHAGTGDETAKELLKKCSTEECKDKVKEALKRSCMYDACTVDENANTKVEAGNLGYDITNLHKCYENCTLKTSLPGCKLPDADKKIEVQLKNKSAASKDLNTAYEITSNFEKFQVKGCSPAQAGCSCGDPAGYKPHSGKTITGAPFFADGATHKVVPNGTPEFRYLCVRGQNANGTLDDIKNMVKVPIHLYRMDLSIFLKK